MISEEGAPSFFVARTSTGSISPNFVPYVTFSLN